MKTRPAIQLASAMLLACTLPLAGHAAAAAKPAAVHGIERHKIPNSDFPIAQAVTLPPGTTIHFISGQVPPTLDKAADPNSPAAFGDTKTQTAGVLAKIRDILQGMDLTIGDVVKMQVFLVGDPAKSGRADIAGFMEAYTQYFGGAQPNLPTRAVVQVAGLSNPGWLVEIEVVAAKK
jgi:enamine deaminase RidA (YjgF/YER057c/UK114 family)